MDISFLALQPSGIDYRGYYVGNPHDVLGFSSIHTTQERNIEASYQVLRSTVEEFEAGKIKLAAIIADIDSCIAELGQSLEPRMLDLFRRALTAGVRIYLVTGGHIERGYYERIIEPLENSVKVLPAPVACSGIVPIEDAGMSEEAPQITERRIETLKAVFADTFGEAPSVVALAPGRANLIGEHVDYPAYQMYRAPDGKILTFPSNYSLPFAVQFNVIIAGRPRNDSKVVVYSMNFKERFEFDLNKTESIPQITAENLLWANFILGAYFSARAQGFAIGGAYLS